MELKQKSIIENGLYTIAAKVVSMLVPLLVLPYILRNLGVVSYGKVSYVQTLVSYFVLFASLGISNYSQREIAFVKDKTGQLKTKVSQIFTISLITTFISFTLFCLYILFVDEAKQDCLLYIAFSFLIIASGLMMDWLYFSYERFDQVSKRIIVGRILYLIFCFWLINDSEDYHLYAAILVFSQFVIPMLINHYGVWTGKFGFYPKVSYDKNIFHESKAVFYIGLMTLGSKLFSSSDVIVTKWASVGESNEAVGYYSSGIMIPLVIESVLFVLVSVVTPRLYYYIGNSDETMSLRLSNLASNAMYFVAVPAVLICFFFPKEIIELFAGEAFLPATDVLQIYSLILLTAVGITIAGTRTYIARRKEKKLFSILLLMAIFNILLDLILIKLWGIKGIALATVISNVILLTIELSLENTWHLVFTRDKYKYAIGGLFLVVVFYLYKMLHVEFTLLSMIICIFVSLILYVTMMFFLKESSIRILQSRIREHFVSR